jgi:serine/threonine protein kinase
MTADDPRPDLSRRRARYAAVSASLRDRDPMEFLALEMNDETLNVWSTTGVTYIGDEPVFVKRVPLTAIECARRQSTRNHFNLPTFYQYGVGSAGFGAFRELAALQVATDWVLNGESAGFPLLYHHCVLPARPGVWRNRMTLEGYVRYWASNDAIERMIHARLAADHELWLFMEFVPFTVFDWLMPANQAQVDTVIAQFSEAIEVLGRHGFVHFDTHLGNMVTDGTTLHLADFGLALGPEFELTARERTFLDEHRHYDLGLALFSLGAMLAMYIYRQPAGTRSEIDRACGLGEHADRARMLTLVVERCRRVAEIIELAPQFVEALERSSDVIVYMHQVLGRLPPSSGGDAPYSDAELHVRLRNIGLAGG